MNNERKTMKILIFILMIFFNAVAFADTTTTTWTTRTYSYWYRIIYPPAQPEPVKKIEPPKLTPAQQAKLIRDDIERTKAHVKREFSSEERLKILNSAKLLRKKVIKSEKDFVYHPSFDCESPSDEDFVKCANEKMTQKSKFLAQ